MKFKDLKVLIESLTGEQLEQPVIVFEGDNEIGSEVAHAEISKENMYWDHAECYGNKEQALEDMKEEDLDELTIVPKGTITLHIP